MKKITAKKIWEIRNKLKNPSTEDIIRAVKKKFGFKKDEILIIYE